MLSVEPMYILDQTSVQEILFTKITLPTPATIQGQLLHIVQTIPPPHYRTTAYQVKPAQMEHVILQMLPAVPMLSVELTYILAQISVQGILFIEIM